MYKLLGLLFLTGEWEETSAGQCALVQKKKKRVISMLAVPSVADSAKILFKSLPNRTEVGSAELFDAGLNGV